MIVEATPLKERFKVSASHGVQTSGPRARETHFSAEWKSAGCQRLSMALVVPQRSGVYPQVEASLHQALRMFNMFHGRAFKSRGCSVQHVKYHCYLHTKLVTLLSWGQIWLPAFPRSGGTRWLAASPVHLPMLSNGGILPLMCHI